MGSGDTVRFCCKVPLTPSVGKYPMGSGDLSSGGEAKAPRAPVGKYPMGSGDVEVKRNGKFAPAQVGKYPMGSGDEGYFDQ